MLGVARLRIAIEEHGAGKQLVRVRSWPHAPPIAVLLGAIAAALGIVAVLSDADAVTFALGSLAGALILRLLYECGTAIATISRALRS